jgi:hypothetical protein
MKFRDISEFFGEYCEENLPQISVIVFTSSCSERYYIVGMNEKREHGCI